MSTVALGIAVLPSYCVSFLDSESYEEVVQYVKREIYEIDDEIINVIADDIRLVYIKVLKEKFTIEEIENSIEVLVLYDQVDVGYLTYSIEARLHDGIEADFVMEDLESDLANLGIEVVYTSILLSKGETRLLKYIANVSKKYTESFLNDNEALLLSKYIKNSYQSHEYSDIISIIHKISSQLNLDITRQMSKLCSNGRFFCETSVEFRNTTDDHIVFDVELETNIIGRIRREITASLSESFNHDVVNFESVI